MNERLSGRPKKLLLSGSFELTLLPEGVRRISMPVVLLLVYGFIVFREVPDTLSFIGMAIMIVAGVYMLHREAMRSRAATTRAE